MGGREVGVRVGGSGSEGGEEVGGRGSGREGGRKWE